MPVFLPSLCSPGLHFLGQKMSKGCCLVLQITTVQWKYSYKTGKLWLYLENSYLESNVY